MHEQIRLIAPVSQNGLRQAVIDVLPLWANPILVDPSQINKRGYHSFIVLSLCRMLSTMKRGEVISKRLAAEWAKQNLDDQWTGLIERAWLGRQTPGMDARPEDTQGTLDLIRQTVQYSDQIRNHSD